MPFALHHFTNGPIQLSSATVPQSNEQSPERKHRKPQEPSSPATLFLRHSGIHPP